MKKYKNYKSNEPFNIIKGGLVRTECNFKFIPEIATKYMEDAKRIADTTKVKAVYETNLSYPALYYGANKIPSVVIDCSGFRIETEVYRNSTDEHNFEEAKKAAIKKADSIAVRVLYHALKFSIQVAENNLDILNEVMANVNYRLSK